MLKSTSNPGRENPAKTVYLIYCPYEEAFELNVYWDRSEAEETLTGYCPLPLCERYDKHALIGEYRLVKASTE